MMATEEVAPRDLKQSLFENEAGVQHVGNPVSLVKFPFFSNCLQTPDSRTSG